MKIISSIANSLSELIPGHFSRYNDDFNENCVGDTFQSLKTPTILFESGHFKDDYDREVTRKYMCIALISSLKSIAPFTSCMEYCPSLFLKTIIPPL